MTQEQQHQFLALLEDQFLTNRIETDLFLDLRAVLVESPDDYAEALYWTLNPPDHRQFMRLRRRFGPNPTFADAFAFLNRTAARRSSGVKSNERTYAE